MTEKKTKKNLNPQLDRSISRPASQETIPIKTQSPNRTSMSSHRL